jgi:hypothetical protein
LTKKQKEEVEGAMEDFSAAEKYLCEANVIIG